MWSIKNRIWPKKFWVTHNCRRMCVFPEASSPGSHAEESSCTMWSVWCWTDPVGPNSFHCLSSLIWVLPAVCGFFTGLRQQPARWRWIFCLSVKSPGPESAFLHLSLMDWAIQKLPFLTEFWSQMMSLATLQTEVRFLQMKEKQER